MPFSNLLHVLGALLSVLLLALPAPVLAQAAEGSPACSPEMIAQEHLVVTRSFLQMRVQRCADGTFVLGRNVSRLRPDTRPADLLAEVARSRAAVGYAESYARRSTLSRATRAATATSVAALVGVLAFTPEQKRLAYTAAASTVTFGILSIPLTRRSNRQLQRTLDAYNAAPPR